MDGTYGTVIKPIRCEEDGEEEEETRPLIQGGQEEMLLDVYRVNY